MNRWEAIKEIQKHATGLRKLIYLFEEYETQPKKPDSDDEVKNVKFVLPLQIGMSPPFPRIAINTGARYGIDFDIVDVKELELEMKGKDWTPWVPIPSPVYIIECRCEKEIKSAVKTLKDAEKELNAECNKIWRDFSKMKRI